jgi:predicted Zn-dependent protease with MMP-like domain
VAYHVSKAVFAELVEEALEDVPPQFARFLEEVPVEIRGRVTARERQKMGLADNALLLGLYRGRPRTERSVEDSAQLPDVIYVFQDDIELVCETEDELVREVRKTVLHEIGHHFGMSEDDLAQLGYG